MNIKKIYINIFLINYLMLLNVVAFSQIDQGVNYKIDSKTSKLGSQINQCDVIYTSKGLNISSSVKKINDGFVYYKTCNDYGVNATIMGSVKTINTNQINKIVFSDGSIKSFKSKKEKIKQTPFKDNSKTILPQNEISRSVMKGTYLLGATQDITSTSWSDIAITPTIGYFIVDKLASGLGFSFSTTDDNADPAVFGQTTTSNMTVSPFVRYYMSDKLFISGGFSMASGKTTTKMDGMDDIVSENSSFGLNVGTGLSLMWGQRVAIEPAFVISSTNSKSINNNSTVDGPSSLSASFSIGLSLRM